MFVTNRRSTSMVTKAGVGMSRNHNPSVAGREAAEQALQKAGVAKPDFVFMFGSIGYDQRSLVRAVRETTRGAPLTGCSAEGTINGDDADESNFSVVVTAISSDELHWMNGLAAGLRADPRDAGKRVAQDLLPHLSAETIGLFVFPDGVSLSLEHFFAGLEGTLSSERFLPMWGGGAGNNYIFGEPTYQYCDDEVVSDGVSYALLYEIDGKPATEVLNEYLPEGALADERDWSRYAYSLALTSKAPSYMKDEEYIVRGVPQLNLTDGSVTVQTEVTEGTSVWFSSRDKEKITAGLDRMAAQIKEQLGGAQPKLVFQFECSTRGKLMFREQEKLQLLKRLRQSVNPDVPWAGFYTEGRELGPVEKHNDPHLLTSVVLALS
jgi:hypothetical protein